MLQPFNRTGPPWISALLVLANCLVYACQWVRPHTFRGWLLDAADPRLPQFLSYAFVHLTLDHLLGNLVILGVLGGWLERHLGPVAYLAFYLAGGVWAGIGFLLAGGRSLAGASGAVAALIGACLVLGWRQPLAVGWPGLYLRVPVLYLLILFLLYTLVQTLRDSSAFHLIAHWAHLGGILFGILCMLCLRPLVIPRRQP